jgi:hypothetical protein
MMTNDYNGNKQWGHLYEPQPNDGPLIARIKQAIRGARQRTRDMDRSDQGERPVSSLSLRGTTASIGRTCRESEITTLGATTARNEDSRARIGVSSGRSGSGCPRRPGGVYESLTSLTIERNCSIVGWVCERCSIRWQFGHTRARSSITVVLVPARASGTVWWHSMKPLPSGP